MCSDKLTKCKCSAFERGVTILIGAGARTFCKKDASRMGVVQVKHGALHCSLLEGGQSGVLLRIGSSLRDAVVASEELAEF